MSVRWAPWAILLLFAAPIVLAHGGVEDEDRYLPQGPAVRPVTEVPAGYTGPGRAPYLSYFEGVWLYGQMTATPINHQRPVDMDVDGDWIVWEDANRSDIFAYSISAGQGFYITSDGIEQHRPKVSGNVVIFEDYRNLNRAAVYAYFFDTGETRRLSNESASARDPDIVYPLVAWLDENGTNPDVWAYSLLNDTGWNLHPGTDRDSDPVVVEDSVYWRTYRYNLWDMVGYDTLLEQGVQVTTDSAIQSAPFSNGEDLFFLTNYLDAGWSLDRYDDETAMVLPTSIRLADASQSAASGDALLRLTYDMDFAQLVVRNLTTGAVNHVSGNLLLSTDPVLQGHTAYFAAKTRLGVSIVHLDVSPFAFAKRPVLTITNPPQNTPWLRPIVMSGILQAGPEFTEPTTFTYTIDDQAPQIIPVAQRWRVTLDPNGLTPGEHAITVRATFREGPPLTSSVILAIPAPGRSLDIESAGPAYHAARLAAELNAYVLDNPASWILLPLLLVILVLLGIRIWIWRKPRKMRGSLVEYVGPDAE